MLIRQRRNGVGSLKVVVLAWMLASCSSSKVDPQNDLDLTDGGTSRGDASYPRTDGSWSGEAGKVVLTEASSGPEFDPDAYWANDPPPPVCLDGGLKPVVPGGTPECPDDKNREGCPCTKEGDQAPCWPGFRRHRNRGVCHDGVTTCQRRNEFALTWGACTGYQLPTGTTGAAACSCFSSGQWKLANLVPCFWGQVGQPPGSGGAVSSVVSGDLRTCGSTPVQPAQPWSTNTLDVDCAGHFKLCFTLKAGSADAPKPTDCTIAKVCTEADYPRANVEQTLPDLPSWIATTPAQSTCAQQFAASGGYGEMSVLGESVECDEIDDGQGGERVFNRVQYCPLSCNDTPTAPECSRCQAGGDGRF